MVDIRKKAKIWLCLYNQDNCRTICLQNFEKNYKQRVSIISKTLHYVAWLCAGWLEHVLGMFLPVYLFILYSACYRLKSAAVVKFDSV